MLRKGSSAVQRTSKPTPGDLSTLAARAQDGGRADIELLLQRVRVVAHRYCRARLASYPGGIDLADDVAQEICIAVLSALPRYRNRGKPFEAFVYGIAARKVADALRALHRHPIPIEELPESADVQPTPEDRVVMASQVATATAMLDKLPPNLREIMLLRVAAGLSAEETGAALGMTAGAVRVAQHRALTKMRQLAAEAAGGEP
ncbi:MAG: polymerase sigma-70 factor, subfamily [Nocardioidaceae bacterium]|jgi:RNA polymerase sigma-70 factor (ECF subfamily)|nr:polymerase sigma-70 factor, subfamily [Nocardioidaceae bacterium]